MLGRRGRVPGQIRLTTKDRGPVARARQGRVVVPMVMIMEEILTAEAQEEMGPRMETMVEIMVETTVETMAVAGAYLNSRCLVQAAVETLSWLCSRRQ